MILHTDVGVILIDKPCLRCGHTLPAKLPSPHCWKLFTLFRLQAKLSLGTWMSMPLHS